MQRARYYETTAKIAGREIGSIVELEEATGIWVDRVRLLNSDMQQKLRLAKIEETKAAAEAKTATKAAAKK